MADAYVQVPPDSTGKDIDMDAVTRSDGTVVYRQRVVVTDPDAAGDRLSLASMRMDRQNAELSMLAAMTDTGNGERRRERERPFTLHDRGATLGRGAVR